MKASEPPGATWWIQQEAIDPAYVAEYEQACREFLKAVSSTVPSELYALRGKNSVYTYLATGPEAALATLQRLGRGRAQGFAERGLIVPYSRRDWTVVEWHGVSRPPSGGREDVVFFRFTFHDLTSQTQENARREDGARRAIQRVANLRPDLSGGLSVLGSSPTSRSAFYVVGEGARDRQGLVALEDLRRSFLDVEQANLDGDDSSKIRVIEGVAYPELSFPGKSSLAQAMWPAESGQSKPQVVSTERRRLARAEAEKAADQGPVAGPAASAAATPRTRPNTPAGSASEAATDRQRVARVVPREPFPLPSQGPGREPWRSESVGRQTGVVPLEPLPPESPREVLTEEGEEPASLPTDNMPRDMSFDDIEALLLGWAEAWAQQRVDDYLQHYSNQFRPPPGTDREQWAKLRRSRISKPSHISVTLEALRIGSEASGTAHAEFIQAYRSDSYRDKVVKRLDLVREDGLWKILTERVISDLARD